jgi:hypothetical protein
MVFIGWAEGMLERFCQNMNSFSRVAPLLPARMATLTDISQKTSMTFPNFASCRPKEG